MQKTCLQCSTVGCAGPVEQVAWVDWVDVTHPLSLQHSGKLVQVVLLAIDDD